MPLPGTTLHRGRAAANDETRRRIKADDKGTPAAAGRIVGGWAVLSSGQVATRLLEDPDADATEAIEAERERLTVWLARTGVVPRFATPLARSW